MCTVTTQPRGQHQYQHQLQYHQTMTSHKEKDKKTVSSNDTNKLLSPPATGPGSVPSSSNDPGPAAFMTPVKQEVAPVTIDLEDGGDTTELGDAGLAGFDGLGQELAFCDTSVTGYEGDMGYDEGEYYAGMEQQTTEADRVPFSHKQYSCQYCGKELESKSALQKHTRVHTKEKPFLCRYCQKSFVQTSSRNAHERSMHPVM
eukprot:GFUD01109355.1.p1 GENE.GFUD01109355.1~~GFUD01109355.1.p1  ORF type:complete len:202 (+),score=54.89 GFUD01109355.1:429-1034(+)